MQRWRDAENQTHQRRLIVNPGFLKDPAQLGAGGVDADRKAFSGPGQIGAGDQVPDQPHLACGQTEDDGGSVDAPVGLGLVVEGDESSDRDD